MRDITEDELKSAFGEKTFTRGQDYFENGYVERGIKKGNTLIGYVLGSLPHPYRTEVEITDDIYSECSCPVETMCKHGVALLLQWVYEKDSFVDCDRLLISLREKSKEELLNIVNSMLEDDPALAWKLAFTEEVTKKKVNIDALSKRLRYLGRGYLEYYEVAGVVQELEKVKEMADSLAQNGCLEDAVEVYLLLIEWGVDAFENGVDDSDGDLGDIIIACVEDFNKCVKPLKEEKRDLIYRILKIMEIEDYGLETQEMLYGLVSKKNIAFIEEELLRRISVRREGFDSGYRRGEILDLLSGLYGELDMPEDIFRVLKDYGLQNGDDYSRIAKALMKEGRHEEAFHYVREGLRLKGENIILGELYFKLLQVFLEEKKDINMYIEDMMTIALQLLSRFFDLERYIIMKDVFEKTGNYDDFISMVKQKCNEEVVMDILLYEYCIDEAVERALSSSTLHSGMLMKVAEMAQERGKEETLKLIGKAIKSGLSYADATERTLIELFVNESDEEELKEAIDHVQNVFTARIFIDVLIKRNQEFAATLLKRFITDIEKKEIEKYALTLENKYVKDVLNLWVLIYTNRSYVYYDDVIDVLKAIKDTMDKKEWREYILTFMEDNRGKKKLLEKMRKLNWIN